MAVVVVVRLRVDTDGGISLMMLLLWGLDVVLLNDDWNDDEIVLVAIEHKISRWPMPSFGGGCWVLLLVYYYCGWME